MIEFVMKLFHSEFMPHGHCYLWRPELVWLHAISDAIITLSYYFIPVALLYFVRKRKELPFNWMLIMFGIFILGCGTTHLMEIWTLWHGTYRLAGVIKAITAAASIATAVALVPLIPKLMALPSPAQLQTANDALASKSSEIQALSANHVTSLESERRHISREVHDEAGQSLIAIKLALQLMANRLPPDTPELREEFDNLRHIVNHSVGQLKELGRKLRPPTLDQLGLGQALEQLGVDHQRRTGMVVTCTVELVLPRLTDAVEIAVYRIAQEGLTNIAKHSDAAQVWLTVRFSDGGLEFSMRDDGRGFDPKVKHRGLGLLGMRERGAMLNACFNIFTNRGEGTTVSVVVPYSSTK